MNETEIMENSTKMLKCLKHLEAQSLLVGGFYGISQIIFHSSINQHKKFMASKYQNTTLINNNC